MWGGRKGKKENQQSPNMYRKPQVIGSSSTNVYRAPVVCDTMLPAVSQCKQEYAARMGMGNAKEVGWFNSIHTSRGQLCLTLRWISRALPSQSAQVSWEDRLRHRGPESRDEPGRWARQWSKEHWATHPTEINLYYPRKTKMKGMLRGKLHEHWNQGMTAPTNHRLRSTVVALCSLCGRLWGWGPWDWASSYGHTRQEGFGGLGYFLDKKVQLKICT